MANFLPGFMTKRNDFNIANINLGYGVYFSQLIRSILSFEFSPFTTLQYSKFQRKGDVRTKTKSKKYIDKEAVPIEALCKKKYIHKSLF